MPINREAAVNPTGLPSFLLVNLFAWILGSPFWGGCWLVSSGVFVFYGKCSDNLWLNRGVQTVLLVLHLFFLMNLQNYSRVSLILDT